MSETAAIARLSVTFTADATLVATTVGDVVVSAVVLPAGDPDEEGDG